ncbi:MAG TPA: hypothetical protein VNA17_03995, partial [Pyrinomonadaceae bacterium]|nr:hypothetical protein [Pyrinomonadaceae bacterium]
KRYLVEISLNGGSELQIGNESEMLVTGLEWLSDKSGLIANAIDRHTKQSQIYHVSYPDGLFRRITNDLDHYQGVSLSADGRRLVTMKQAINRQIWSHAKGKVSRLTVGDQLHIDSVDWIGDDSIAFSEDVNGTRNNYNIWRMRADGTEKQQLTFGGGYNVDLTASPDERYIAFISRRSGRDQVWRVGVDGTGLVQLTNVDHNVTGPMFSPDSRKVYFLGWVDSALRLFQVPVDGGEATPVLNDDIYQNWAPSPEGKRIAYLTFDRDRQRRRVSEFSLETRQKERVLDIIPETCLRWAADGRALFFTSASDGVLNVWRSELDGQKPEPVTAFADERIFRFAVSPRSGHLAVVRESITYDAIMLTPGRR